MDPGNKLYENQLCQDNYGALKTEDRVTFDSYTGPEFYKNSYTGPEFYINQQFDHTFVSRFA